MVSLKQTTMLSELASKKPMAAILCHSVGVSHWCHAGSHSMPSAYCLQETHPFHLCVAFLLLGKASFETIVQGEQTKYWLSTFAKQSGSSNGVGWDVVARTDLVEIGCLLERGHSSPFQGRLLAGNTAETGQSCNALSEGLMGITDTTTTTTQLLASKHCCAYTVLCLYYTSY